MIHKYELQLKLISLEAQLASLLRYTQESQSCFDLLQLKLDELSSLLKNDADQQRWEQHAHCIDLNRQLKALRETAIEGLCKLEKHLATQHSPQNHTEHTPYFNELDLHIQQELKSAGIEQASQLLFIGSGAYPKSICQVAAVSPAQIIAVDIDKQAIDLAKKNHPHPQIQYLHGQAQDVIQQYQPSHVFIASLVEDKWGVIQQIKPFLAPGCKLLVRFGNGFKSIFNYPFNPYISSDWQIQPVAHQHPLYDSVLMEAIA